MSEGRASDLWVDPTRAMSSGDWFETSTIFFARAENVYDVAREEASLETDPDRREIVDEATATCGLLLKFSEVALQISRELRAWDEAGK